MYLLPTYIVKTRQRKTSYLRLEDEAWEKMAESLGRVLAATAAGGDVVLEASVTLTCAVTLITLAPAAPPTRTTHCTLTGAVTLITLPPAALQHTPLITHSLVQSRSSHLHLLHSNTHYSLHTHRSSHTDHTCTCCTPTRATHYTLTGAVTLITPAPAALQHTPLITHSPVQSR